MNIDKKILDIINKNLKVKEFEKKLYGEVFTSTDIIFDMMSKLPKNIFSNVNFKWLDPACGVGNYSIVIYYKLMDGLKYKIKNEKQRSKHIIENMIYMIELNSKNVALAKSIFKKIDNNAYINISNADFINQEKKWKNNLSMNNRKFDVIISNPPFQKQNKTDITKLSTKPLYDKFVIKSFENLSKNGYLSFIHPVSWRRVSKEIKIKDYFFDNKLLFIYTNNNYKGFGKSAPLINYYVLQNTPNNKTHTQYETIFDNKVYKGTFILNKSLKFIPMLLTNEVINILNKILSKTKNKLEIQLQSRISSSKKNSMSAKKNRQFKYKNVHNYSIKTDTYNYRWSKKKHPNHHTPKIVMNFKGGYKYFKPIIAEKNIGVTDNTMFVTINNKPKLLQFLKSDLIKFILKITQFNYGSNAKNEFHILNLISIPPIKYLGSNNDVYKYFNLTEKEKNFINKIIQ